jgi:hypothetical protein
VPLALEALFRMAQLTTVAADCVAGFGPVSEITVVFARRVPSDDHAGSSPHRRHF